MSAPGTPPTPLAAEEANGQADPLAGDWSEGLPGPLHAHGVPPPKRISMNGHVESAPAALREVHDAHELLQSELGEPAAVAEETPAEQTPPADELSFTADLTPPEPAPVFADQDVAAEATAPEMTGSDPAMAEAPPPDPESAQESAPTPWSEPVPDAQAASEAGWDSPPAPDPDVTPAEAWMPPPETEAASPEAATSEAAAGVATEPDSAGAENAGVAAPEQSDDLWAAAPAEPAPAEQAPDPVPDPAPVPDETWSTQAEQPVEEWQPESAPADFEEVRAPASDAAPAAAADWSSLSAGPDWNAPAAAPEAAPTEEWSAPAPAAATEWNPASPAAVEPEWSASAPVAAPEAEAWSALEAPSDPAPEPEPEWSAPPAEPPKPTPAWNQPAVGASALEQLDSEPPAPDPGAAKELFGSVPDGGMLAGEGDDESLYQPPEELASPEEFLRPLPSDDPDLPAPTGEPARTGPRPQPLAAFRPPGAGALEVHGEHRVAIHTRGGRTLRGTVRDIDLSKSQFALLPQGGGGIEAIYHSDVKAIFFMLAPGEKANEGDGSKVRVTFVDGRVIEGVREGADAKHGFFLVPLDATRTNTRRIYVAREAASEIDDG